MAKWAKRLCRTAEGAARRRPRCRWRSRLPRWPAIDITLAPGQTGDLSVAVVIELYLGDPFAAGAVPSQIVVVTGTPTLAHYSFTITHGDFHVVVWKDENLNNTVDSGDLYGWHDGAVNGTGQPVAASVHLDHGQSGVANVAVSVRP